MFDPHNHYWRREDGVLFSSAKAMEVLDDDPDYSSWLEAGGAVTVWPRDDLGFQTDAALQDVLRPYGIYIANEAGLAALKTALKAEIDAQAETERLRYITPGEGQALTYQRKTEEAKRATEVSVPSASDYPLLAASIGIDGTTIKEVADVVIRQDAAWALLGAEIERTRLTAKRNIDLASDDIEAREVPLTVKWPSQTSSMAP
ncbi:hypothetical protein [Agrobacterium tumefaciens]|uniref:hypothetical protein n=1 Tax=Agrobacterium tumefaciens TaxID=358 RepID=UPI0021FA7309|nr:hypothetical protein FY128_17290 [Agrobacterium tumefaciens]